LQTTQLAHPYPVNPVSLAGGPASAHASTRVLKTSACSTSKVVICKMAIRLDGGNALEL
jgi:hypothetical protein